MKILVVEDEYKIANSLNKGLRQEKYVVDVAYDGEKGLDLALGEKHDLIILDRMLPKISGDEILSQLREKGIHTPVILLTAKGELENKIQGLNNGADDYIVKPFSFSELIARIRAVSRRPQNSSLNILKVNDLTMNLETYEVKRISTSINLSSKEFSLLEYLMRNQNKILKKEQIILNVWNYEANVLPNTIEVYIKHLRDKIDKPFKSHENLIHTVRGFGYRIG